MHNKSSARLKGVLYGLMFWLALWASHPTNAAEAFNLTFAIGNGNMQFKVSGTVEDKTNSDDAADFELYVYAEDDAAAQALTFRLFPSKLIVDIAEIDEVPEDESDND